MLTILEGQISFGGVHDALDAVSRHKNVKNGVLRISSNKASGLIGVFCGRFITGAFVTLTGETGQAALQKLIAATDGTFAFMDAMGDDMPELKQSLAVDIALLSSTGDNTSVVSEQTLTGATEGESIELIDTSINFDDAPLLTDNERAERLSKTYDKLMSLAEYEKMRKDPTSEIAKPTALTPPPTTAEHDVAALRRKIAPSAPVELTDLIPQISARMEEEEQQLIEASRQDHEFEPRELTASRVSGPPPVSRPIELTEMMPEISRQNEPIHEPEKYPVQSFGTVGYINHEQQDIVEHSEDDYDPTFRQPQDARPSVNSDFKRLKHWPNRSRTISVYLSIFFLIALSAGGWVAYNKYVAKQAASEMGPPAPHVSAQH